VDLYKARDYLDRAITLADLAVVVISRFMDPKKVASHAEYTDKRAYISEVPALATRFAATRSDVYLPLSARTNLFMYYVITNTEFILLASLQKGPYPSD
jgi:hypothetical protein